MDDYKDTYDTWPMLPRFRGSEVIIPPGWLDSIDAIKEICVHFKIPYEPLGVHVHWMENAKRFISLYYGSWVFSLPAIEFRVLSKPDTNGAKKEIGSVVLVNKAMLKEVINSTPTVEMYVQTAR